MTGSRKGSGTPRMPVGAWIALGVIALAVIVAILASPPRHASPEPAEPGFAAKQQAALAERKAAGWQEIERGLLWRRVAGDGKGRHPTAADTVRINYEGKLADGTVFDTTREREPVSFALGGLIEAWQLALPKAGVGDTIEIAVPPALGYGERGAGPIPGGAVLLFEIQLVAIE